MRYLRLPRSCLHVLVDLRFPGLGRLAVLGALLFAIGAANGCGQETTEPGSGDTGPPAASFEAQVDPESSSFLLSRVSGSVGNTPVDVELVGSNFVSDPSDGIVSIDVAIRNTSRIELSGPALVWLESFQPRSVVVVNPDIPEIPPPGDVQFPTDASDAFGFDYTGFFGEDGVLMPGETSGSRTWSFRSPGLQSFTFAATARFDSPPPGAVISGSVFHDINGDGRWNGNEPSFAGGVTLQRPDGTSTETYTNERGFYRFLVEEPGLYTATYFPPPLECVCDVQVTTINPLQVVIVPDADGQLESYEGADFGARVVYPDPHGASVVLTDLGPDEIRQDDYQIGDIGVQGDHLYMLVGFSGCGPDHDFDLFMSGGFRESLPVQTVLVLGHDNFGEACDAWFERRLVFDLAPIRRAYEEAYGEPGVVILNFTDLRGNHYRFVYEWEFDPDWDDGIFE